MSKIILKEELKSLTFDNLRLKSIYSRFNISHSYASELFKKEIGKTFREWRKEKIIEETERYLINTAIDMDQLARNLGYSDKKKFRRFFKKETGLVPEQFRGKYTTDKMAPK